MIDETQTARRLTLRIIFSTPHLTFPAAALAVVHQVGEAFVPVIVGLAIDRALATGDLEQFLLWVLVLGLDFLILSLGFRFAAQLTMRAVQLTQHRLRAALSTAVLHPSHRRAQHADGDILSTATNDVASASSAVTIGVFPIGDIAGIGFIAATLFMIHPPLGLTVLVGAPLVVIGTGALSRPFARRRQQFQTLLAGAVAKAADLVAGYRVIKGIGAENEAIHRYRVASRAALTGAHRSTGALGRYLASSGTISGAFVAIIGGLAAWFAVEGRITVGELITVVGLAQVLLPPLFSLTSNAVTWWATAIASSARIVSVLADSAQSRNEHAGASVEPLAATPTIELVIDGQRSIRIEPGELVGIRTDDRTALRIATALLAPRTNDDVRVSVDGVAAESLDRSQYRSRITVAPHVTTLFTGTIAENLDIPGARSELKAAAASAAVCDDFVTATRDGWDSHVGENGNRLSGGQRQRVALARALTADAPVLVLHDPTTAVDSVTEAVIADRLRRFRRGRSTLIITASPALLGACDRVTDWVVERHSAGAR
ncbi:MAG: ABC transporter transmembrane domain-containing protein [Brachybacterium sp.]|uniref:ABC transporter transmembrane domain-containing protein n=1 Tax=Brachybacterium sp. TaxID=1891286 RepID=UPI003F93F21C